MSWSLGSVYWDMAFYWSGLSFLLLGVVWLASAQKSRGVRSQFFIAVISRVIYCWASAVAATSPVSWEQDFFIALVNLCGHCALLACGYEVLQQRERQNRLPFFLASVVLVGAMSLLCDPFPALSFPEKLVTLPAALMAAAAFETRTGLWIALSGLLGPWAVLAQGALALIFILGETRGSQWKASGRFPFRYRSVALAAAGMSTVLGIFVTDWYVESALQETHSQLEPVASALLPTLRSPLQENSSEVEHVFKELPHLTFAENVQKACLSLEDKSGGRHVHRCLARSRRDAVVWHTEFVYSYGESKEIVQLELGDLLVAKHVRLHRFMAIWVDILIGILSFGGFLLYQKNRELLARESESDERFRQLFLFHPAATLVFRQADGCVCDANAAFTELCGYAKTEIVGRSVHELNIFAGHVFSSASKDVDGSWAPRQEIVVRHPHGQTHWCILSAGVVRFDGEACILATLFETTATKNVEAQLANEQALLRNVLDAIPIAIFCKDKEQRYINSNRVYCAALGLAENQMIGKTDEELDQDLTRQFSEAEKQALASGQPVRREEWITFPSGERTLFASVRMPIFGAAGQSHGLVTILRDISYKRAMEDMLHKRDQLLLAVSDSATSLLTTRNFEAAVHSVLWSLGANLAADHACLYENRQLDSASPGRLSLQFEWCSPGSPSYLERITKGETPPPFFARWLEILSQGQPVFGPVRDFPAEEQDALVAHGIVSILLVPIIAEGVFWGVLAFDDRYVERSWAEAEISLLAMAGLGFSGAIFRERVEEDLRKARDEAHAANLAKGEFIANVSHEIRTPINGILGMANLLMATTLTPEQREYAETIEASVEILLRVINDILDFSKIEAGRMELETIDFDLRTLLDEVSHLVVYKANEKNLDFYTIVDHNVPSALRGDPGRIQQILMNLVGNACKFTSAGEICVRVSLVSGSAGKVVLRFMVRDTGIGIPEDRRDHLFRSFSQVDSSTSRRFGGTGLGLAICRRLVSLMNGEIWLESAEGKGSTFWFTLALESQQGEMGENHQRTLHISGKRMLVVAEGQNDRIVVVEHLKSWGVSVEEACNANQALAKLHAAVSEGHPFHLAFLSDDLSESSCYSLAKELARDPFVASTKLVLIDGHMRRVEDDELLALNFSARIQKPLRSRPLIEALYRLMSGVVPVHEAPRRSAFTEKSATRKKAHILVAEDNATNQLVARRLLEQAGYQVDVAEDGKEVLAKMTEEHTFDLILMDVQMPMMDGLEAAFAIRKREKIHGGHLPIVAMTAHALGGYRQQCLDAGMDDYLVKPIQPEALFKTLDALLSNVSPSCLDAPHYNGQGLLDRMGGEEEIVREIVALFLCEMPRRLDDLRDALNAGKSTDACHWAHSIKGAAANLGAEKLHRLAQAIESTVAQKEHSEHVRQLFEELCTEFAALSPILAKKSA